MFGLHFSLSSACVIIPSVTWQEQPWLGVACFLLSPGVSLGSYVGPRPLLQNNWFSHANALLVRTLVLSALPLYHRKERWSGNSDLCVYLCSFRWAQDGHVTQEGKQTYLKGSTASGWDLVDLMQTASFGCWQFLFFKEKKKNSRLAVLKESVCNMFNEMKCWLDEVSRQTEIRWWWAK